MRYLSVKPYQCNALLTNDYDAIIMLPLCYQYAIGNSSLRYQNIIDRELIHTETPPDTNTVLPNCYQCAKDALSTRF